MKKRFKDQYTQELSRRIIDAEIQPDEGILHSILNMFRVNKAALLGLILILIILLTALLLICATAAIICALRFKGQKTPPLRPFFAQADDDDLFWRKKREKQRKEREMR